jgi:hypothetical protein
MTALLAILAACQSGGPPPSSSSPAGSAAPTPTAGLAQLVTAHYEVGPPPGPEKPYRGVVVEDVQVYDGWVSMRLVMRNTGEEPITFLNTLYDYEPLQLYEPLVRLEWTDGVAASSGRHGRFFPTPAILQPGEEAVYLVGGQPVLEAGSGQIGNLVTHIKYCPTRGMDDAPGLPLEVSDVTWETHDGVTTVRGVLHQTSQDRRFGSPTVGVEFTGADGEFLGAVVDDSVGERMDAGESRPFEISGPGVRTDGVVSVTASAWVR